ncbi:MAG: methylmalonyl-CoA mutase family protein, partial [Granulosicoccaceae bacterium]
NQALLHGLSRGATALQLILQPDAFEQSPGVRAVCADDLATLLKGVKLDALPILIDAGAHASAYGEALLSLAQSSGANCKTLQLMVNCDPAAALATDGSLPGASEEIYTLAATQAVQLLTVAPQSRALSADSRVYHAAGASAAQELACSLSAALEHLRALEKMGVGIKDAGSQILFRLALDADIFAGAVKQRALRVLWSNICQACGDASSVDSFRLHAETSTRMLHRFDPWVNQLRTTAATLAAALGGATYLSVHGYDEVDALPSALATRCARNNQLILQQESHLYAVADPLGGSGFAESYTDQLVTVAWQAFQEIEAEGGLIASLSAGNLQQRIAEVKAKRLGQIAKRRLPLTGVSEFPNLEDSPPTGEVIEWETELAAAVARADTRLIELPDGAPALANALQPQVLGEQFEALRLQALEASFTPRVALVTIGKQAQFTARATFVSNLLAAGGIHSAACGELDHSDAAVAAWQETGVDVAILCGSDDGYKQHATAMASALRQAGCQHIYLAGKPGELETTLSEAGVKGYAVMGMDAIAYLQQIHADLGVSS